MKIFTARILRVMSVLMIGAASIAAIAVVQSPANASSKHSHVTCPRGGHLTKRICVVPGFEYPAAQNGLTATCPTGDVLVGIIYCASTKSADLANYVATGSTCPNGGTIDQTGTTCFIDPSVSFATTTLRPATCSMGGTLRGAYCYVKAFKYKARVVKR